jgi:hypothetical protein
MATSRAARTRLRLTKTASLPMLVIALAAWSAVTASASTPTAPTVAPTDVIATLRSPTQALVSYTPIVDSPPGNGGSTIRRYVATCGATGQPSRTGRAVSPFAPIAVNSLARGVTYACRVAAVNAVGTGPESAPAVLTAPTAPTVAPSPVQAVPSQTLGSVIVEYVPVTDVAPDNGGSPITRYLARCASPGHPSRSANDMVAPFTVITIARLVVGVSYTCTISAANVFGVGPAATTTVVPGTLAGGLSIGSVTPRIGPTAGGTSVDIVGSGFQISSTVTFGGVLATSVTVVSATEITTISPPGSPGTFDLTVNTPDGGWTTSASGWTYSAPVR